MKKYCVDTSGISNPLETTPEDIHQSAWVRIKECISNGDLAVTKEIYDEMIHIGGSVGECIKASAAQLVLELAKAIGITRHTSRKPRECRLSMRNTF